MPRKAKSPSITVTGPNCPGRNAPELGAAISLAQFLATRRGLDEGTWYVRDPEGNVRYHVILEETGVVTTTRLEEGGA